MDVVKKKVFAFSHVTNQTKGSYIVMRRIKSLMDHLMKVTWHIWLYSYVMNWIESQVQDGYAQATIKIDMLAFSIDED